MGTKDKRIDAYIARSEPFAQPILEHLRYLVHKGCPDVTETMKWSFPHFDYKGIMCAMAAFKKHCVFGFWKASLMKDKRLVEMAKSETSMGHLGRIEKAEDLPSDRILLGYIKEAARLNDKGIKVPARPKAKTRVPLKIPASLKKALAANKRASATFNSFSYSNKKEYVTWITEAKSTETRERRLRIAIQWMSEGKIRNWKYVSTKVSPL